MKTHDKCIICGRKLKSKYSQQRGMGKVCEHKVAAPQLDLFPLNKKKKRKGSTMTDTDKAMLKAIKLISKIKPDETNTNSQN